MPLQHSASALIPGLPATCTRGLGFGFQDGAQTNPELTSHPDHPHGADRLGRRLQDPTVLQRETAAWEGERNRIRAKVHWHFTTIQARTELQRFYPA